MRFWPALFLLAAASPAQDEALEFGEEPVSCKSIRFEVAVPKGWKVAKDRTGLSAQGKGGGFVITREPFLGEEKGYEERWQAVLAQSGIQTEVKSTRAGRYPAFRASWPAKDAPGITIEVYRVYVEDLEMLYNIAFSVPKGADSKELVKGVLRSFKVTDEKKDLELERTPVDVQNAGRLRLPKGCVETKLGPFSREVAYRKMLPGYAPPKLAVEIRLASYPAHVNLPSGSTSDPEALIPFALERMGLGELKWEDKPKFKAATYDGVKGQAQVGRVRQGEGEILEAYVWAGKGKGQCPVIAIFAIDRETRLHRNYFKTILKSFESRE